MSTLFNRRIEVKIGIPGEEGRTWGNDLDMAFSSKSSGKKKPNQMELVIWNLGKSARGLLEESGLLCVLSTGYAGSGLQSLFYGDVLEVEHTVNEADVKTTLLIGDGARNYTLGAVNKSFTSGATSTSVIEATARQMGLRASFVVNLGETIYENGYVAYGLAREILDEITEGLNGSWSIQKGVLQVTRKDEGTNAQAVVISSETGLVGSPTKVKKAGARAKRSDGVKFKTLLNPRLVPGGYVQLNSRDFSGFYLIREVSHTGSNYEQKWYSEVTATSAEPPQTKPTSKLKPVDDAVLSAQDAGYKLWDEATEDFWPR